MYIGNYKVRFQYTNAQGEPLQERFLVNIKKNILEDMGITRSNNEVEVFYDKKTRTIQIRKKGA